MVSKTMNGSKEPFPIALAIPAGDIDSRLPEGEILLEVFANGQCHLAFREDRWDTWPVGVFIDSQSSTR